MEKNPILYVILNKELKMSAGKAAAQTAHAVAMLDKKLDSFMSYTRRTVVVLEADNAEQIRNLYTYLDEAGVYSDYYIDEGENEVPAYSITALAVEPFLESDEEKRAMLKPFRLYTAEGDPYEDAYYSLREVSRFFRRYDGMGGADMTPRWMRKTIAFLEKRIK